jgi:hypothetical protein
LVTTSTRIRRQRIRGTYFMTLAPRIRHQPVWTLERRSRSIALQTNEGGCMNALMGWLYLAVDRRLRLIRRLLEGERAQGTVEYVGLILLVSLLMVGMVAAMKGFNGKQGTELAGVIIEKIKQAVSQVSFR